MTRQEFLRLVGGGSIGAVAAPVMSPLSRPAVSSVGGTGSQSNSPKTFPAGVTPAVVRFITETTIDRVPAATVVEARRCLIDGFGVVLAGSTVRGSAIVREYVNASDGTGASTILGPDRMSASASQAALANGASGHAMDYDDTQLSSSPYRVFGLLTHPTVPVLAASLAVSERLGATGKAFLEAFLVGFEVECKIAEAIHPEHYVRGYHSTGTIGTFGAVASAAKLLRLSPAVTAHALGIAASMGAGIRVNFGSMTKPLHAGRAAENGVTAAELAARGFTAGDDALDGEWGFFQVAGGGADVARIAGALGAPFSVVNPGVSIKPYPCG